MKLNSSDYKKFASHLPDNLDKMEDRTACTKKIVLLLVKRTIYILSV